MPPAAWIAWRPSFFAVPLDEGAVAEADRAAPGDPGDLVARPPEGAIDEPHAAGVGGLHLDHRRVRAVEGDELAVGDQQAEGRGFLDHHGRVAIVGADAEEVAVADAAGWS